MDILLRVERSDAVNVKLVWSQGARQFERYHVSFQKLQQDVDAVRAALESLVEEYVDRTYRYGPSLRRLAEAGSNLHFRLFRGAASAADVAVAEPVSDWLDAKAQEGLQLTICTDPTIHVPWALVYSGDVPTDGESGIDAYEGFWAFRHRVSTLHYAMQPGWLSRGFEPDRFKVLSMIDQGIFETVMADLPPEEQGLLTELLQHPLGPAYSKHDSLRLCEQARADHCLVNIFSHATGTEIRLAGQEEDERIHLTDLERRFLDPRRHGGREQVEALHFLNGCNTAVGTLDASFLDITARSGGAGFVGSEAVLPDEFALRIATVVLHGFLREGLSAHQIVRRIWRRHWPLGLLYGCYAAPDFRLAVPDPTDEPAFLSGVNFSLEGSE